MPLRYLLDEHIEPAIRTQLLRVAPDLEVWIIGIQARHHAGRSTQTS
jgi:hypothetical protein